ncbi:MAG: hypothetical protein IJ619_00230 [Eubacterium sp.]|nr:hypothetical protein [Eubacterium sp.]
MSETVGYSFRSTVKDDMSETVAYKAPWSEPTEKLIYGWIVQVEGQDKGKYYPIFEGENTVDEFIIIYDADKDAFQLKNDPSYIHHHDVIQKEERKYMLVQLCVDGFSWHPKKEWRCIYCNSVNPELAVYCQVCGGER